MGTKKSGSPTSQSPSELIDARIESLGDWRGEMLSRLRGLIKEADPQVVEEWKWRGVPVWYHDGMICTGETYKSVVKMTFAKGASLKDPARLYQRQSRGEHEACHRLPRGRECKRACLEGSDSRRRYPEQIQGPPQTQSHRLETVARGGTAVASGASSRIQSAFGNPPRRD
jgi:hypothetical protein